MSQNSSQLKLTDGHEIFFDQFFFLTARTQKLETGQKKLPIMAPVSKHSETPKNRIARNFFRKMRFRKILGLNGAWLPDSFFFRNLLRQGNTNRNLDGSRKQT